MTTEKANAASAAGASVGTGAGVGENADAQGTYNVVCVGPKECFRAEYLSLNEQMVSSASAGRKKEIWEVMQSMLEPKWGDLIKNVVTTEGKNDALDEYLAGSAYTAAWYMGLQNGAPPTTSSTYAVPICTEVTDYTEGTRPAPAFSAAAAGSKATSSAVSFSINATVTVDGVMLFNVNTKGDTGAGVLYSAGDFSGGSKAVANGDTLNVTYTASL